MYRRFLNRELRAIRRISGKQGPQIRQEFHGYCNLEGYGIAVSVRLIRARGGQVNSFLITHPQEGVVSFWFLEGYEWRIIDEVGISR
jgi:hypothetical protein